MSVIHFDFELVSEYCLMLKQITDRINEIAEKVAAECQGRDAGMWLLSEKLVDDSEKLTRLANALQIIYNNYEEYENRLIGLQAYEVADSSNVDAKTQGVFTVSDITFSKTYSVEQWLSELINKNEYERISKECSNRNLPH